ncbi:MAG: ABC transporter permease [Chloroflexota bacterium]
MLQYIVRRLLISVPVLLAITALIFTLLQFVPGDPLDAYAPPDLPMPASQRIALRHALGLDQPPVIRYFYWLGEALHGNLGLRTQNFEPVSAAIGRAMGPTLALMGSGLLLGIVVGIGLGVLSVLFRGSWLDAGISLLAYLGISMPAFWVGLVGLYIFALVFHLFPAGGFDTPGQPFSLWDHLDHLILPATLLSLNYIAVFLRYTRSALLEILGLDYVRTARAKGLPRRTVLGKHALRNALLPVVTIIGSSIPTLVGGAVFIESIFSWPGMGQLFIAGVDSRDYALIMGMTLVLAVTILLANLLTDLAYALIDPQVRLE